MGQVNAMVLPFPALELRRDQGPRPRLEPAHDSVHVRFGEGRLCSSELLARTGCKFTCTAGVKRSPPGGPGGERFTPAE